MRVLRILLSTLACGLLLCTAHAADDRAQQRARIAAERREANERFNAAKKDCEQRFAVTTCLDDARSERRRVLDRLASEQAVLDDAQRRLRAAERLRGIQEKARLADDKANAAPPLRRVQRAPASAPGPAPRASASPHPEPRPGDTPQLAEQRRQDQAGRAKEVREHREAVEKRNAERDAKKAPAAPLPVPSAPATGKR